MRTEDATTRSSYDSNTNFNILLLTNVNLSTNINLIYNNL